MTAARVVGLAITALSLVYLQLLCMARLQVLGASPAILLLVPLLYALHGRPKLVLPAILVSTAVASLFSAEPLPLLPVVYGGVAAGLFAIRDYFFRAHPLTELVTVGTAAALATAILQTIDLVRFGAPGIGVLASRALVTGGLTGVLAPIAFRVLRWLPTLRGSLLPAAR